jgi:hypothetical protein
MKVAKNIICIQLVRSQDKRENDRMPQCKLSTQLGRQQYSYLSKTLFHV